MNKLKVGDEVRVVDMPVSQEWYDKQGIGVIVDIESQDNGIDLYIIKWPGVMPFSLFYERLRFCNRHYEQDFLERIRDRLL